jgi:hypothetical protein
MRAKGFKEDKDSKGSAEGCQYGDLRFDRVR